VLVIDNGTTDDTVVLAEKSGAIVIGFKHSSFARIRNEALKHVQTEWVLYIDADERVTPDLAKEISVILETEDISALSFDRHNYFFGQLFTAGGWQNDIVTRGFKIKDLEGWSGNIHESPTFSGSSKKLIFPLLHFSHRSVADGLIKSATWTGMEAELLFKANEPPVTVTRVIKKAIAEFIKRALLKKGYADGQAGWFEAIIQAFNRALVYIQVWEMQQKPTLPQKYQQLEKQLQQKWKTE
jgi:(heptosyl)LPS beta-1,4-glucosyltransferase